MVIFLFIMFAHLTVGDVKVAVSVILFGGSLASIFWVWVVLVGLLIPALVELVYVVPRLLYRRGYAAPRGIEIVVPVAVLIGGFMLRYVIVVAGQITGPVGI
jgi:formate-dependent nitrite reductase membrane component NrfD